MGSRIACVQVVILNVFVVVMAFCFEPAGGAIEAFTLDVAQRKRTGAILKARPTDALARPVLPCRCPVLPYLCPVLSRTLVWPFSITPVLLL